MLVYTSKKVHTYWTMIRKKISIYNVNEYNIVWAEEGMMVVVEHSI